jgi:hypothetical protein
LQSGAAPIGARLVVKLVFPDDTERELKLEVVK